MASFPPVANELDASNGDDKFIGGVLCVGLACLDMQLIGATKMEDPEAINTFQKTVYCAGGSAPMTSTALGHMGMEHVGALIQLGDDGHGAEMRRQLGAAGVATGLCAGLSGGADRAGVQTAVAVLPVFREGGGRACWVDLAANDLLTGEAILQVLSDNKDEICSKYKAFHFGYPHLLKNLQGEALQGLLAGARRALGDEGLLVSVDLNGVDPARHAVGVPGRVDVLGPALPLVDVLHANAAEARLLTGEGPQEEGESQGEYLRRLAAPLLAQGLGCLALTLGAEGAYLAVNADLRGRSATFLRQGERWRGQDSFVPAYPVSEGSSINANGAGDAYIGGLVAAALWQRPVSLEEANRFALLTALQRVDSSKRDSPLKTLASDLMKIAQQH